MPAFEEDPALLSKSRLISHLVFHNVKLPPTKSRKVVYVELYQRHIKQRKEVEFSSEKEEEEEAEDLVENEHVSHSRVQRDGTNPEASEVPDPSSLTDRDLKAELLKHGVTAGPIVASLHPDLVREEAPQAAGVGWSRAAPGGRSFCIFQTQAGSHTPTDNDCSTVSSQAFSITQMVEEMENRKSLSRSVSGEREVSWSDRPEHCSRSKRLDEPVLESRTTKNHSLYLTPIASPCNQEKKELVKVNRQHLPAETTTNSRPVLNATCRRPIKWAAMHPMQRKYPDTPVSPRTWEKQEIDRRLVPIHVQIFFFLAVMCLLYLSYTWA
ncbi:lamina-associated polypeptide 2, isoforms beta/gamma-like [Cynoglossus semilaevis]|uniref:lamina-associated polypeptide 2, isoforms beta/gamma-like n=1 Tax=Cynoglossus semilaevis TaxID=244447 RepID=UPI000D62EFF3|nr:lamina-associated polypeptide 2, isoforms beta/gamma-like [Cynoglossus semilaevis]